MWKRAAQFAPFAALKGYEEAIKEAERKNEESYEPQYDDRASCLTNTNINNGF